MKDWSMSYHATSNMIILMRSIWTCTDLNTPLFTAIIFFLKIVYSTGLVVV